MWSINFHDLFENYNNFRKWQNEEISYGAFVFGDVVKTEITDVLFSPFVDLEFCLDTARLIENSLPSNVTFVGALSLAGWIYPFDLYALSASAEDPGSFFLLFADELCLDLRDTASIISRNEKIRLRPVSENQEGELIARTSLRLSVSVNMSSPGNLRDKLASTFIAELPNIESLCFAVPGSGAILGRWNEDETAFHSTIRENCKKLASGRKYVDLTSLLPAQTDPDDLRAKLVPIAKIKKGFATFCNMNITLFALTELQQSDSLEGILNLLRRSLKRAVFLAQRCISEFSDVDSGCLMNIDCNAFSVSGRLRLVVYPRIQDDSTMRSYRTSLHRIFNLSRNKPVLKPSQSLVFDRSRSYLLQNPHLHIKSYKPKGEVYCVNGAYNYHHYMQDGIDDSGWGCAYRSFQTIWSWFVLQGYIDKPVPTHREIQQNLHDCGDKDAKFVGSRQWIGSIELGYCLANMAGIDSRIITTNSGKEVAENARQLTLHFKIYGTPVMIGGGMLAHTILGVDFNDSTGETSFLILDPHYTGDEDLQTVITKGWCGWKGASFWKQEHFYNLLLPVPPQGAI